MMIVSDTMEETTNIYLNEEDTPIGGQEEYIGWAMIGMGESRDIDWALVGMERE